VGIATIDCLPPDHSNTHQICQIGTQAEIVGRPIDGLKRPIGLSLCGERSALVYLPMLRSSRSRTTKTTVLTDQHIAESLSRAYVTKTTVLTDQHIAESLSRAYVRAIAPLAGMRLAIENWGDRKLGRSSVQLGDAIDRRPRGRDRPTGWHEGAIDNWGDRAFSQRMRSIEGLGGAINLLAGMRARSITGAIDSQH
jgi:hypothetical protein